MADRFYDGSDVCIAQDRDTAPAYLPRQVDWVTVNRQMRGGIRKTRPPFQSVKLVPADEDDTAILDIVRYGNFQGAWPYRAIKYNSSDGIIASFAGTIVFFVIVNNMAYVKRLMDGNDPSLMHTWFVQAEDWIYVQNGYQNAIAWDGDLNSAAFRLNPVLDQMPIGTIMEYAHGRVFVSTADNNIYASDIIFGNGFTDTSNTQNFTETTYWQEGGSFTPPSNLGLITGMKVMPTLNINDRGQGELVVFCEEGAFTLNVQLPRSTWIDAQIQKVSMIGRGNISPWSVTSVNNEIMCRSDDGWSLYSNAQVDFNQKLSFRKFSREVNQWVDQDTPWMKQFASGLFFDNRFIGSVSPYIVPATDTTYGLHRPHRGMIVLDLDQTTASAPDASVAFRWNGLWTGPQPLQFVKGNIRGQERAFCFSFDTDGENRLYEFKREGIDDFRQDENQKIKSFFITKRYDFAETAPSNRYVRKRLVGGTMWISNVNEKVNLEVLYRPDSYPCFETLMPTMSVGCDTCSQVIEDCGLEGSQAKYAKIKFPTPNDTICQIGEEISTTMGAEFQLRFNLEGSATVDRFRLAIDLAGNLDSPIGDCPDDPKFTSCQPITCCDIDVWDYYKF